MKNYTSLQSIQADLYAGDITCRQLVEFYLQNIAEKNNQLNAFLKVFDQEALAKADEIDQKTGIPIISLYGKKNKPSAADLADVDILIYDLQDVGVRFYTNINALSRLMEACEANKKTLLILDRPNPNGYLIDGPILDMKYKSGIGMFPIPMSHGLTVGEFAQMVNGEGWLKDKKKCKIATRLCGNAGRCNHHLQSE